jgi:oligopeptide transport system permease protein
VKKNPRRRFPVSSVFLITISAAGFLAPWIAPASPSQIDEDRLLEPPSQSHWMGTDELGRDLFTRTLFGARVSLAVGLGTAILAMAVGSLYGLVSGHAGGKLDDLLMRIVDIFYSLPDLVLIILVSLVTGRNMVGALIALSLVSWVRFARLVRGQVLQIMKLPYIEAARAGGATAPRILFRHILPNLIGPLLVTLTFSVPAAILAESTLSFIGLGINDPYSPWGISWGTLAQDGWRGMRRHPHLVFFPGAAIFLTILALNFLGDSMRNWLDPKMRL